MDALLSAAQWVVGKALVLVADGVLGRWDASKKLGLNVDALSTELLLVKATLEAASRKQIGGHAMEELLRKLQDSARCAEDLLDELDYYRIHDQLHGRYDAADQHAKGGVHDLALNARHTARAVGTKLLGLSTCSSVGTPVEPGKVVENARQRVGCCAWPRARRMPSRNASSMPNTNRAEVTGCMTMLGTLLPCSSSPVVHDNNNNSAGQSTLCGPPQREHGKEKTIPRFNRADFSERMNHIVDQLQPVRREFTTILQTCDRITVPNNVQSRAVSTGQSKSTEPKLYGRDQIMDSLIHDMTQGKYHIKNLTVLPIVGPGGIGKTTLVQHIYHNKYVQTHFQVVIWVCVSLIFNLNKLLEDINKDTPAIEGEKGHRPEELIEQRLKSKRFLLVLDDIWTCNNEDDWERLLMLLKTSNEKGNMILVTTRFPAIAKIVGTNGHWIELEGLESKYFRELFYAFVFGDDQSRRGHSYLLETGDKIMEKLKGSPLAAKTVGRLLRKNFNLRHWRRVLESKEWERQTGANDIMPALKLSYDYLPFHQQQCFSYSALLPEDHEYSSTELINLWIGLDILQPDGENQTLEDMGLRNLNDLVTHGFFKEAETTHGMCYVMHDLLHDLALNVASHECLTMHHSNVGPVEIQPSIHHVSIIIDYNDTVSRENIKSQLRKLKTILKVKQLRTLMLFGKLDESFANILCDLFREANAIRVLHLVNISSSVLEFMLHNFSALLHLRFLCVRPKFGREMMHLPLTISRFYHLRILDIGPWCVYHDLPKHLSNLTKLCHFYTPSDKLHSDIVNVGKLVLLEELEVFRVNKENEGFEPNQLEHLTELRELGIYNLENIHTKEAAEKAKLIEKNYLVKLTLDWDSKRSNVEPGVEAVVLENLQPHRYLEELCIRGHGGPSCPPWLGDNLAVEALESLHLDGVSWQCLPSLGKMWGLGKLILKRIAAVKEFVIEQNFCRLIRLELVGLGSFSEWVPSNNAHIFPLLQVLIISDCPKLLELPHSNQIVYPKPDQGLKTEWFPKLQKLVIDSCPEFLLVAHIPWTETLHQVNIRDVKLLGSFEYIPTSLIITGKVDLQSLAQVLAFSNLTGLEMLKLRECPPMELKHLVMLTSLKALVVDNSDGLVRPLGGEGDIKWQLDVEYLEVRALHGASGKKLTELLTHLPKILELSISMCGSMTQLAVGVDVTSVATSEVEKQEDGLLLFPVHLSESLEDLAIYGCPELVLVDPLPALRSLHTLTLMDSPKFLSKCVSPHVLCSSKLRELYTDDVGGLLVASICSILSSSLTKLQLDGTYNYEMEHFTKEQKDALHLLASLQELEFYRFSKLQHLPVGLHKLTNLRRLEIRLCPALLLLPNHGLPKSLQELDVCDSHSKELIQQCRGLVGIIPAIRL